MKLNLKMTPPSQCQFNGYKGFSNEIATAFSVFLESGNFSNRKLEDGFYNDTNHVMFESDTLGIYFIVNSSDIDWIMIEIFFFDIETREVLSVAKYLESLNFDRENWEKKIKKAIVKSKRFPKCIQVQIPYWVDIFENHLKNVLSLEFSAIRAMYESSNQV